MWIIFLFLFFLFIIIIWIIRLKISVYQQNTQSESCYTWFKCQFQIIKSRFFHCIETLGKGCDFTRNQDIAAASCNISRCSSRRTSLLYMFFSTFICTRKTKKIFKVSYTLLKCLEPSLDDRQTDSMRNPKANLQNCSNVV